MSKHTQSIIVFGLVIPSVLILAVIGGVLKVRSSLEQKKNERFGDFSTYEQSVSEANLLNQKLSKDNVREKMSYWTENLEEELTQSLIKNLNGIMSEYTDEQLRRTSLSRPSGRSSLASNVESKYTQVSLGFEGGFGPMQETLAALELMMPQLTLESLEVTPTRNVTQKPYLEFEMTYLAWSPLAEK